MKGGHAMIRIAVVDDELLFLEYFSKIIKDKFEYCAVECEILTYSSGADFQEYQLHGEFDLIFLDIDLPDISGIQLASELRKKKSSTTLMFVSAHNQFVFESIKYKPFRFIKKADLLSDVDEAIKAYCRQLKQSSNKITLSLDDHREKTVDLSDIMYFYSLRHEIYYVSQTGVSVRLAFRTYTLELLEKTLKYQGFIRTHKTYLVNCSYIYKIQTTKLILKNNTQIGISRGRTDEIKEQYQIFLREEEQL